MKHLIIHNLGPLKEADIDIKQINVIIGPQSSGKSCVLKTACYCTWVEKRIQLTQTADYFKKGGKFIEELERFHKLKGYVKNDTYIEYESDFMTFSYSNESKFFTFRWKENKWNYIRPKVTYIPAERNMVAAIPNWFQVKFADDNIRDFMTDWEYARLATQDNLNVLNLGVKYHYNAAAKTDLIEVADGVTIDFTNTSSGLQSVIPLFVHLNYLFGLEDKDNSMLSVLGRLENIGLRKAILKEFAQEKTPDGYAGNNNASNDDVFFLDFGNEFYTFKSKRELDAFKNVLSRFVRNNYCEIFLEEPELNLFPPTQISLVEWILDKTKGEHPCNLFIATHSPYILTAFLEKKDIDLSFLYTARAEDGMTVKTATQQDIQDIFDYGLDVFFNTESLGQE